ncbi:tlde1 domain-containing protein [Collimonas antrihumi]|uniref:tlde1 domain-containing protein n=1 Tax=Collimonas antrihumi TaxID=1940615 RepID=UPI003CCEE22F
MVRRGEFRLHPASWRKISKGCVTINDVMAWQRVKSILRRAAPIAIPDSSLEAYGRLTVR